MGAPLRGLDHLVGAQTPCADANAPDASIDHRPHRLQVRFEPPRAHVVRVAHLPADDRTLTAYLATFRHILQSPQFPKSESSSISARSGDNQGRRAGVSAAGAP